RDRRLALVDREHGAVAPEVPPRGDLIAGRPGRVVAYEERLAAARTDRGDRSTGPHVVTGRTLEMPYAHRESASLEGLASSLVSSCTAADSRGGASGDSSVAAGAGGTIAGA